MPAPVRPGHGARIALGLTVLFTLVSTLTYSSGTRAADNIWQATFGQNWFYELRSSSGEVLAGTWWEASLTPGNTYHVSFNVESKQGKIGVLLGDNPAVTLDHTGAYAFDFYVSKSGNRRLLFQTQSGDAMAAVNRISVTAEGNASPQSNGGGSVVPKGHYIAIDRELDLKTRMVDPLSRPWTMNSGYQTSKALDLSNALKTPGVKGIWMRFDWRSLEVGDGVYNWRVLDDNIAVARRYGLKFIVQVSDRSFDGSNILPRYFPSRYVIRQWGGGNSGVVSKRWDPWVYTRLIRLYKAIASRYAGNAGFGGIATTETATGNFSGGDYSAAKYRAALTQIVTQTEAALTTGKLFFYLNFILGGDNSDMNQDARVKLLGDVPHRSLVVGAPDITPDMSGMPRSVTNYRIHVRKTMPDLEQFCHLQHNDMGQGHLNIKTNRYRQAYADEIARERARERQSWFTGRRAVYEFGVLPGGSQGGGPVAMHPQWQLGRLWQLPELFDFGQRNFGCDYVFWHYREFPQGGESGWQDVQPVILNHQYFYN